MEIYEEGARARYPVSWNVRSRAVIRTVKVLLLVPVEEAVGASTQQPTFLLVALVGIIALGLCGVKNTGARGREP